MSPLFSPIGVGGATAPVLKQTITTAGSVTIPAGTGFVYAVIGASANSGTAAGWVPADTAFTSANGLYYYSYLCGSGPNLYLYY